MVDKKVGAEKLSAKDRHKLNIVEYLANPDNKACNRTKLAKEVLGITIQGFYKIFTTDELSEIEDQALKLRRSRYATKLAMIDEAMIKKAIAGSEKAAELCYRRLENWIPNQKIELQTPEESLPIKVEIIAKDASKKNNS